MAVAVPALLLVTVAAGIVVVVTTGGEDPSGSTSSSPPSGDDDGASAGPEASGGKFDGGTVLAPARLLDSRLGSTTVDGELQSIGPIGPDSILEIRVADRGGASSTPGLAELSVTAVGGDVSSEVSVSPCGSPADPVPSVNVEAGATATRTLLVPVGSNGAVCVGVSAEVHVAIDLNGTFDPSLVRPLAKPVRLLDTRANGETDDGKFAGVGVRPEGSTIRLPVSSRFSGLSEVAVLVVSVTASDPLEPGELSAFAPEAPVPSAPIVRYEQRVTASGIEMVPFGATGELCVSTTGRTDVTVDIVGLVPSSTEIQKLTAPETEPQCPGQQLFPSHRIVALYGTQRSARLGVLGEQDPAAAVARVEEIAEPWRAGDTPVMPAFELIATLATGSPEDRGDYNIRSKPEFVQEYLDVARRNGYYLILDLQAGQSDFLTEAKYYEDFLRQPDVGLALDPEWRTEPPARPRGGYVGRVDAAEVNAVIDYLAQLVEEEGLPEKLLVVHQFQDRMITNRSQLVEQPGVALTIHMDGFGPRAEKLNSYDVVRAEPPWNMGLKLFFDEDTDIYEAPEVLDGVFDPIPDLVSYQ